MSIFCMEITFIKMALAQVVALYLKVCLKQIITNWVQDLLLMNNK